MILSCSKESSNDIDNTDPVNPIDLPPIEVSINELSLPFGGMTTSDISRTFYDVSGTFIYSNNFDSLSQKKIVCIVDCICLSSHIDFLSI